MFKGIKNRIKGKKKHTYKFEQTAYEHGNGFQSSVRTLSLRSLDTCCGEDHRFDSPYYRSDSEYSFSLQDTPPEVSKVNDEYPPLEGSSLKTKNLNVTSTCTGSRQSTSSLTPSSQPTDERYKPQQHHWDEHDARQNECAYKPTDERYKPQLRECVMTDARQNACSCNKIEDTKWNYKLPSSQLKIRQNETNGACNSSYKESSSDTPVQETDRKVLQASQNNTQSSYSINVESDSDDHPYSYLPDEEPVLRHSAEYGQEMEENYDEITESNSVVNKRSSTLSIDSAYSDKSSSSVSSIETNLRPFQKFVEESVSATDILTCLTCIGARDEKHITAIDRDDPVKAMRLLLCRLKEIREPGKWQEFIEALERKEYVLIAMVLKGETLKTFDEERHLIRILAPQLIQNIYLAEFVDKLFEKRVISEHDKETIERREIQDGAEAATGLLLKRMTTKSPSWFKDFVQVCRECHLNKTVDLAPLFDQAGECYQGLTEGKQYTYRHHNAKRRLPPPLPPRTIPDSDFKTSEHERQPPPLPNTLPPKGKPQHYQSNTSLHCISEQGAESSHSSNSDENSDTYVDSDSLYKSRNDRIPMLKRKKTLLEKKLKDEKTKTKLRREIKNLQEQIDDITGSEHMDVKVMAGYTSNDSRTYRKSAQQQKLETEGLTRRNSVDGQQNSDMYYKYLQTKIERLKEKVKAKKQARDVKELATRVAALEKGVSDSDEELYEDPDAEEENDETSRYISQDLQTADDDDYDEADDDKGKAPQSDSSEPRRDLLELRIDMIKEELKTHISDEIQKLHLSNMYGYTDGYRTAHLNEKMLLYTAGQDYRGITIPLGRTGSISQFPLVFMPDWSYYNLTMSEGT